MSRDQQRPAPPGAQEATELPLAEPESHDAPSAEVAVKLVAALDRLARALRQHRQGAASKLGITPLQAEVLRTLYEGPPPEAVVGLLARELGVTQPTVTDSVNALVRKGLVARSTMQGDRRRTRLELTGAGHDLVATLTAAESELIAAVAGMGATSQETAYVSLLELIARFVDTGHIEVARTCLTCRYLGGTPESGRHCLLLDMPLPDPALRVNCPEHEPRPA